MDKIIFCEFLQAGQLFQANRGWQAIVPHYIPSSDKPVRLRCTGQHALNRSQATGPYSEHFIFTITYEWTL
jgi:hypothetical protein